MKNRNLRLLLLGQVAYYTLFTATLALTAASLSPNLQGDFTVSRVKVYLCETFIFLGFSSATTYLIATNKEKYSSTINSLVIYLTSATLILYFCASKYLGIFISPVELTWLTSLIIFQHVYKLLLGRILYRELAFILTVNGLLLISLHYSLQSDQLYKYISYHCLANFSSSAIGIFVLHKHDALRLCFVLKPKTVASIFKKGIYPYLSTVFFLLLYRLDLVFAKKVLSNEKFGEYTIAVLVAELFIRVPEWGATALMPILCKAHNSSKLFNNAFKICVAYIFLVMIVCLASEDIINFLCQKILGEKYFNTYYYFKFLIPRICLHSLMVIVASRLASLGYTKFHPLSSLIGVAIFVTICFTSPNNLKLNVISYAYSASYLAIIYTLYLGIKDKNEHC